LIIIFSSLIKEFGRGGFASGSPVEKKQENVDKNAS